MSDVERSAIVIGITGGIACGKSEVGRILGEAGFAVCDADRVAHDLMKKGTPVFHSVVDRFGLQILSEEGGISRPILGKLVFENPKLLETLNRLVHPAVREYLENWIERRRVEGKDAAVLVPLLFESGMEDLEWNAILCVSSLDEAVYQRLEKRGLTHGEAEKRVQSQMPLKEKEERADQVIPNFGTLKELETATRQAVEKCRAKG